MKISKEILDLAEKIKKYKTDTKLVKELEIKIMQNVILNNF